MLHCPLISLSSPIKPERGAVHRLLGQGAAPSRDLGTEEGDRSGAPPSVRVLFPNDAFLSGAGGTKPGLHTPRPHAARSAQSLGRR